MTRSFAKSVALAMLVAMLVGCASVSKPSLVGSWKRPGPMPTPDSVLPQFLAFTFSRDGVLDFTYVNSSGGYYRPPLRDWVKTEHARYDDLGSAFRLIAGANSFDFPYEIKGGKLYVAPLPKSQLAEAGARQILERQ